MLDTAVRLSLQSAATNGASTSSGYTSRLNAAAVLRATAAERRLARNRKASSLSIEDVFEGETEEDEEVNSSESDSRMSSSESDEEPLAKKAKTTKKSKAFSTKAVTTPADLFQYKRQALNIRRELRREEKELMYKLGRRLTNVHPLPFLRAPLAIILCFRPRLRKQRLPCTDSIPNSRPYGVI